MEFSSSSDDDGAMEQQLRRHRSLLMQEESAITRVQRVTSGNATQRQFVVGNSRCTVVLPSGESIEARNGTIFLPVRSKYAHVNEAKARPQDYFGDPSVRLSRRPRLDAGRVVLKELSPNGDWSEARLPGASVTGIYVFDRVDAAADKEAAATAKNHARGPVNVLGDLHNLPAAAKPMRRLGGFSQLQRKVDFSTWSHMVNSHSGFSCAGNVVLPTADGRRLCSAATADAWGTIWTFNDDDRRLSILSRKALNREDDVRNEWVTELVATVPPADMDPTARTLGILRLPEYQGDGESTGGAVAIVSSCQVSLALLPQRQLHDSTGDNGGVNAARTIACPVVEQAYHCWCPTWAQGGLDGRAHSHELRASSFCSSTGVAVGTERTVVEMRFESDAVLGSRWGARQVRQLPKTSRVTALGTVGVSSNNAGGHRFLLLGMRNGTIQVCNQYDGGRGGRGGQALDALSRHNNASVVSLQQLSTHDCQFASVSSEGEVRVWDLRYFAGARDAVSVVRNPTRMNYDGRVKVSWCGDLVALASEPGGFCFCANATRPGTAFTLDGDDAQLAAGDPTVLLTSTGTSCELFLFGGHHTQIISLDAV